ncbi:MAG: hypothetical protein LBN33_05710 [Desulfovibrio sp.]|jgi:hypothetical protein|nr:hypothetical protein [Desulfovibrio sp.]
MGFVDYLVEDELSKAHNGLAVVLNSDVLFYYGPMAFETPHIFAEFIQKTDKKKQTLTIVLTTGGGMVEPVERAVEIIRRHYRFVNFIVPDYAMSAGTVFCMSGDKIFMDQASSLGPIDPQVQKSDGTLVPAMGYLEQLEKLIDKSIKKTISPAEIDLLRRFDLGDINRYEQARNLTVTLLKKWLVTFKFKNWKIHKTTPARKGHLVTDDEKICRAEEIAKKLGDISIWHSHGRHIGITTLKKELRLRIEDYTNKKNISDQIMIYNALATDYIRKNGYLLYVHSGSVIRAIAGGNR